ncbi:3-dehydroquinate synthase [Prochlorothrix hollandica]|uniref:3-dehydroquinate synthase n=1 Tax=Prochlorothrix hollandica PCC 9006 = CALU 1027 TaxID=317619 RepID=A0A0M2PY07_PROHO|nr:3-dehydroquinate synthase [Prochlorothrix hollandica]KKJ01060.1 3-dehydroquinate synthase [Prochlorothrix hollandica PCC 9006 = CALU 1027]
MAAIIPIPLPQNSYNVVIAAGELSALGTWMTGEVMVGQMGKRALLVSNPTVFAHYGETALASLRAAGFEVAHHLIPDGEQYKTLDAIAAIYNAALAHRLERSSVMVALGGGVVGDMTGFAAATWLRGISFVQVPTSLLAMVDASIGGKTGVNHPQGKNLIGAFHQPRLVLIDPDVLATLPEREFRAGMAEVIKYGVIWDLGLFERLEQSAACDRYDRTSPDLLHHILVQSCQAKADVVSRDEKEGGLRAILNYGHTLGHAIESLMNYEGIVHGEGVALGMVAAGHLAHRLGLWSGAENQRQQGLIDKAQLPRQIPPQLSIEAMVDLLASDKKVKDGKVRFVLPTAIGSVTITDQVPGDLIGSVVADLQVPGGS